VLRLERQVLDLKARIAATRNKYLTDTRQELARLEEELSSSRYKLDERASILAHTDLLSPTDGLVKYIRVSTVGGVLKPGDELMQISPVDDELLVELKINPADIGQLATGMPVSLRFDAFDSSLFGKVEGSLTYISPDTLSEQGPDGSALVYYRGQVRIDWSKAIAGTVQTMREDEVKPGMTVTADVLVGKRTILYYLLKPVMRGFSGALTER
jgi:adhesin transport system membrane fusion protein